MFDVTQGKTLGAAQAAKKVPPDGLGRPAGPAMIIRWIVDGVKRDGVRIRLEGAKLGGRWVTSEEALRRFAERLTPASAPPSAQRTPAERRRADERADGALRERGV